MNYNKKNKPVKTLEEQFKHKERIVFPGGDVEVVDIVPNVQKFKVPVILGVGWGGRSNAYKNNVLFLAKTGRRTIIIDAIHGIDYKMTSEDDNDLPAAELRKAVALINVLDNKNINKVDAIGYSEGGIYVTLAALLHPEKFRSLVLVNPGGMIGKDGEARLTAGFLQDLVKHFIKSIGNKEHLRRFAAFYGGMFKSAISDIIKAVHEISAISDSQIQEFLHKLKNKGIGISIIHSVDDHAFPMDRMKKITKPKHVDNFYSVKGSHGDFVIQAERYTAIVERALNDLENKRRSIKRFVPTKIFFTVLVITLILMLFLETYLFLVFISYIN